MYKVKSLKPKGELPSCSLDRSCTPRRWTSVSSEMPSCSLDRRPVSSEKSERTGKGFFAGGLVGEAPGTASEVSGTTGEMAPQVYLRLRPVGERSTSYSIAADGSTLITRNKTSRMVKRFGFTAIFDSCVDQRSIYNTCVGARICKDESATIMTYGTSGSGKTFTLLGDEQSAGIIPRALYNIFSMRGNMVHTWPERKPVDGYLAFLRFGAAHGELEVTQKLLNLCPDIGHDLEQKIEKDHTFSAKSCDPEEGVMIWISFVEIYNEMVYDLLEVPVQSKVVTKAPRRKLKVVWNAGKVYVQGMTKVFVQNSEQALRLLRLGQRRSASATTEVNRKSSRSHRIFTVEVIKRKGINGQWNLSIYKFCDLAGSERVNSARTTGKRLNEAKTINKSLMTLGRCLDAACRAPKSRYIDVMPCRDSKLTMLLQGALVGQEKLAMIVNVSPLDTCYEENLNVLHFASVAKNLVYRETVTQEPVTQEPVAEKAVAKEHHSSSAGSLEISKLAADKDGDRVMAIKARNIHLELKIAFEGARYEEETRLLREEVERLTNSKTDPETTEETEESSEKVKSSGSEVWQNCNIM